MSLPKRFMHAAVRSYVANRPPRPPCQDRPPPVVFPDAIADHLHWCRYAREPHEIHACHGCDLEWIHLCTCTLADVSVGGKPEYLLGKTDPGCPTHGGAHKAAMEEARHG